MKFSRTFDAALRAAKISHTEAAGCSGLTQTSVSRTVSGGSLPTPRNLGRLLFLLDPGDADECVRQYLLAHTPEQYQDRVQVAFTDPKPPRAPLDELGEALLFLEAKATANPRVAAMLISLSRTLAERETTA